MPVSANAASEPTDVVMGEEYLDNNKRQIVFADTGRLHRKPSMTQLWLSVDTRWLLGSGHNYTISLVPKHFFAIAMCFPLRTGRCASCPLTVGYSRGPGCHK